MEKKFEYELNKANGIVVKTYHGLISIEDIESSWEYAFENDLIPEGNKRFILDYRDASFSINIDEFTAISDFYKKHIDIFRNSRIAVLTLKPKDTTIPYLVALKDEGYLSRPFSTLEAAINWVVG